MSGEEEGDGVEVRGAAKGREKGDGARVKLLRTEEYKRTKFAVKLRYVDVCFYVALTRFQ